LLDGLETAITDKAFEKGGSAADIASPNPADRKPSLLDGSKRTLKPSNKYHI
jgi:hypothetical protein